MKAVIGAFNQKKALVGAFSVNLQHRSTTVLNIMVSGYKSRSVLWSRTCGDVSRGPSASHSTEPRLHNTRTRSAITLSSYYGFHGILNIQYVFLLFCPFCMYPDNNLAGVSKWKPNMIFAVTKDLCVFVLWIWEGRTTDCTGIFNWHLIHCFVSTSRYLILKQIYLWNTWNVELFNYSWNQWL